MIISNRFYSIELSDSDGTVTAYSSTKQNFIKESGKLRALLEFKLLKETGEGVYFDSNMAKNFAVSKEADKYVLSFDDIYDGISAKVFVRCPEDEPFMYWSCEINNSTGMIIEWVGLPGIVSENGLKGNGGNSELFWPFGEGCLIDDMAMRENSDWLHYRELTYQSMAFTGVFPGPASMQFMAYYNELGGLYLATHDPNGYMKSFEYHPYDDGLCLEIRHFADAADGSYKMQYEVVTGVFDGDWQDAAEIYRGWLETTDILPEKIADRTDLPEWYEESPVVVVYPIRGRKDYGDMTPNMYYPYENMLPLIDEYSEKMNSKMMALLMHWEGTAPWAPPYVWPPFGGEEEFVAFADKLHEKNHLIGAYCSGIGWTAHSYLDDMDISDKYKDEYICRTPDNKIVQSLIIGKPIRDGYDMCPHSPDVAEIVKGELESLAGAGCDYVQYFDQNIGGNSCYCYARHHGHPAGPGKWQTDDMKNIFKRATENIPTSKMLVGCEMAASEPFIKYLPFNDVRYNFALMFGKPVPAYAYLYHEYINNFMGNQNIQNAIFDMGENPDNVLLRIGYSFAAGDMLTIALADEGKAFWGWDVDWDIEPPHQESIFELISNLNAWRVGFAKKYLHLGKMVKSEGVNGIGTFALKRIEGRPIVYPDVFVVTYEAPDGTEGMFLTNYLREEKEVAFNGVRKIWTNPKDENDYVETDKIVIKPLSAVAVEFNKKYYEEESK